VAGRPPAPAVGIADQWRPAPRHTQPDLVRPPRYLLCISPADMASHAINPARVPPFASYRGPSSTSSCRIRATPGRIWPPLVAFGGCCRRFECSFESRGAPPLRDLLQAEGHRRFGGPSESCTAPSAAAFLGPAHRASPGCGAAAAASWLLYAATRARRRRRQLLARVLRVCSAVAPGHVAHAGAVVRAGVAIGALAVIGSCSCSSGDASTVPRLLVLLHLKPGPCVWVSGSTRRKPCPAPCRC